MPYVQMPKDLTKVKTKVAFNLTKRQIICFGLAVVCAVPTYFLTRETICNRWLGNGVLGGAFPKDIHSCNDPITCAVRENLRQRGRGDHR